MPSIFHSSPFLARSLVLPLAVLPYLATGLLASHFIRLFRLPTWLFVYCVIETTFLAYQGYLYYSLQARRPAASRDQAQVVALFLKALSFGLDGKALDSLPDSDDSDEEHVLVWRKTFAEWFFGHDFCKLGQQDVLCWLAWSIFDKDVIDLDKEQLQGCEECLRWIQRRGAWKFQPGATDAKCVRLALDPVRVRARPLVVYIFVLLWTEFSIWHWKRLGFVKVSSADGTVEALLFTPEGWTPSSQRRPLLFLHGLGLGVAQYTRVVLRLHKLAEADIRPVLVPLQPSISMTFFHRDHLRPPSQLELTNGILSLMDQLDWPNCDVLSHSMGTIVHGWLLKARASFVKRSCFVDPVCFCLWQPDVPLAFLYNKPSTGIEILMAYFVAREIGIAVFIQRYFDWTANLLFADEIPNVLDPEKTSFYIAGQDAILSAPTVVQYLGEHGISKEQGGLNVDWDSAHGVNSRPWSEVSFAYLLMQEALMSRSKGVDSILTWLRLDSDKATAHQVSGVHRP